MTYARLIAPAASFALGLAAVSLSAQQTQPEDASTAEETEDPGDKKVCKLLKRVNTRIPTKTCKTQADWDEDQRMAQDSMSSTRNRNSHCPAAGPC